jgi:hypothetical protein
VPFGPGNAAQHPQIYGALAVLPSYPVAGICWRETGGVMCVRVGGVLKNHIIFTIKTSKILVETI